MGSVYKRGRIYWIDYYKSGERIRESSQSTERRDAEALLLLREGEAGRRQELLSKIADLYFDYFQKGHPFIVSGEEELREKLAMMTGLRQAGLPKRYREMLGGLVSHTERCLRNMPRVELEPKHSEKEAAVLLISDLHSGKQIWDDHGVAVYNRDICAFRMALLKERLLSLLTKNLRPEKIDELHILLLGDLVDGSGIYPGQELNQDITDFSSQISLATASIWDIVRTARKELGYRVSIKGVRGNHGRQHKYAPAANNFDFLVYQMLKMLSHYEDDDVDVEYATTTDYLNFEIKGRKGHIRHEAPVQTETPAARAKFGGWRELHDWEFVAYGHKHHPGNGTYMDYDCFMNGSVVGTDDLAERLAVTSRPSQTLFGVDPDIGVSFRYNIYLDKFGKGGDADDLLTRYPMLLAS